MATRLEITNAALVTIGERPLISMNDETNNGIRMRALFPDAANHVVNQHSWSELTVMAEIEGTLDITQPYMNRRIIKVLVGDLNSKYEVIGNLIRIRSPGTSRNVSLTATLRLILFPDISEDTSTLGPFLSDAITARLIYRALIGRPSLQQQARLDYSETLVSSIANDSQQGNFGDTIVPVYDIITDR